MIHQWLITDGPESLSDRDNGQRRTFTITLPDTTTAQVHIQLTTVGKIFGGAVKSFGGMFVIGHQTFDVVGTYNVRDHSGQCQTTAHS